MFETPRAGKQATTALGRSGSTRIALLLTGLGVVTALLTLYINLRRERLDHPQVTVRVERISVYGEIAGDVTSHFAPWVGLALELANSGRQTATIRNVGLRMKYRPLDRNAVSTIWYVSGTRPKGSSVGNQTPFLLVPGTFLRTHVTVSLLIGTHGLTEAENREFLSRLSDAKKLHELFEFAYVTVWDTEGRASTSDEFFAQGPEVLVEIPATRTKTSRTWFRFSEPQSWVIEMLDAERQ